MTRTYLDNAATSWPKPTEVYLAMDRFQREVGVAGGRGGYQAALRATDVLERTRQRVRQLFRARADTAVVFGCNGTDVLNLAIQGSLAEGGHVVSTTLEHNSVLRPLMTLQDRRENVEVTLVPPEADGRVDPRRISQALRDQTRLVCVTHVSNVTGVTQDIAGIGNAIRGSAALLLVDAAQSAGHLPIALDETSVDMLATSGHKGLLGPLGTGLLCLKAGVAERLQDIRQGGTGGHSSDRFQPTMIPEKFESGSHNTPALAGLLAGLDYLVAYESEVHAHVQKLTESLLKGLLEIDTVHVVHAATVEPRVGLVSLYIDGVDPHDVAAYLESSHGIEVRAGLHCAPLTHDGIGTAAVGGTLRVSFGPFNSPADVRLLLQGLSEAVSMLAAN